VGFVVDKVALGRFSPSTSVSPANIIPPLLHSHLSPPHEVCDCSDQAAHYHNLGPKLGASLLTRHIGWKQKEKKKKGKKKKKKVNMVFKPLYYKAAEQTVYLGVNV
jgi:hypothetical protein